MEGGCRALYLGPELPDDLRGVKGLVWARAVDIEPIDASLREAAELIVSGRFDCVALTSPRGPALLRQYLASWPSTVRALCVGPGTARAFTRAFSAPCPYPADYTTEALARLAISLGCRSVLSLRSEMGDKDLELTLGGSVNVKRLNIYKEIVRPEAIPDDADVLIASSALIAEAACRRLSGRVRLVVAIGPKAADAAMRACGGARVIVAAERSFKAVRSALAELGCY